MELNVDDSIDMLVIIYNKKNRAIEILIMSLKDEIIHYMSKIKKILRIVG